MRAASCIRRRTRTLRQRSSGTTRPARRQATRAGAGGGSVAGSRSPANPRTAGFAQPRRPGSAINLRRPADRRERARAKPACRAADWCRAVVGLPISLAGVASGHFLPSAARASGEPLHPVCRVWRLVHRRCGGVTAPFVARPAPAAMPLLAWKESVSTRAFRFRHAL